MTSPAIDSTIRHGTLSAYVKLKCRCPACTTERRRYRLAMRAAGLAADDPRHGSYNGYKDHGCRCAPCRHGLMVYRKAARARARRRRLARPLERAS